MKLQFGPFLVILALLSARLAWSQAGSSDSSQSGSAESSQQQQASDGPQPVFTHPEERPPLAMLDEVTAHSFINVGLGATVAWDSNANSFGYPGYSQTVFIATPSFQLRQTRPTFTWYVGAESSLQASDGQGYYRTSNPVASAGFIYQLSRRWQLYANDHYIYSADLFQQYSVYSGAPSYNQPNPTVYVPLATTEANYGSLNLTYQMSAHDSLTFTGTENFTRYLHTTYSANNVYSWGGAASYQHLFSARVSAGGGYSFTSLDFGHGQSRSGIQQFQFFASYRLNPHMSVRGWIGPEYTVTKNLVPIFCDPYGCFIEVRHDKSWSTGFGGNFGWSGQRNAAVFGFSRSITNGGLLLGITQAYQVNGNFSRQLSPRWSFNLGGLYGNNTGYSTRLHAQHLTSFTGSTGFSRQLTPTLSASLQYIRIHENQQHVILGLAAPTWTDNRVQFTLHYDWSHSLGR